MPRQCMLHISPTGAPDVLHAPQYYTAGWRMCVGVRLSGGRSPITGCVKPVYHFAHILCILYPTTNHHNCDNIAKSSDDSIMLCKKYCNFDICNSVFCMLCTF